MTETVSLKKIAKGESISLEKLGPGLKQVRAELSWKKRLTDGPKIDLDISVFLLGPDRKLAQTNGKIIHNFVFYGNLESPNKAVWRTDDEREGGVEYLWINPSLLGSEVSTAEVVITIHEAKENNQNFGQITDAEIVFINDETGEKLAAIDLDEDHGVQTAVHAFTLYKRKDGQWAFKNVDEGSKQGLAFFVNLYGLAVEG